MIVTAGLLPQSSVIVLPFLETYFPVTDGLIGMVASTGPASGSSNLINIESNVMSLVVRKTTFRSGNADAEVFSSEVQRSLILCSDSIVLSQSRAMRALIFSGIHMVSI